jgi:DNA-binding transcriptional MerR regulator
MGGPTENPPEGPTPRGKKGESELIPPVPKLYRIGEIMRYTSLSRQTIHNYTVLGLITEAERTDGNQRLYGEETFARLTRIGQLKKRGKTLREIREILDVEYAGSGKGGNE